MCSYYHPPLFGSLPIIAFKRKKFVLVREKQRLSVPNRSINCTNVQKIPSWCLFDRQNLRKLQQTSTTLLLRAKNTAAFFSPFLNPPELIRPGYYTKIQYDSITQSLNQITHHMEESKSLHTAPLHNTPHPQNTSLTATNTSSTTSWFC